MNIYVIKPNTLHPDAMFFLKEEVEKRFPTAKIMENQSGPNYDPNMIHRCDKLFVAIGTNRSIGKGVYGEVLTAQEESKEVVLFEFDPTLRKLNQINKFEMVVTDSNNYRAFAEVTGEIDGISPEPTDEDLM